MRERAFEWCKNINRQVLIFLLVLPVQASSGGQSPQFRKIGSFFTTFYYVVPEKQYSETQTAVIKNKDGDVIAHVNATFKHDMDIEGTGILRNGVTVNYAARIGGDIRYRISSEKWGWGVGQCALKPYHTVAVDPKVIALGSLVYIPAANGMHLPDGTIHDGIFYAEDIGEKINSLHVDFFCQEGKTSSAPYETAGIHSGGFVDVYKYQDPDPDGCQVHDPETRDI